MARLADPCLHRPLLTTSWPNPGSKDSSKAPSAQQVATVCTKCTSPVPPVWLPAQSCQHTHQVLHLTPAVAGWCVAPRAYAHGAKKPTLHPLDHAHWSLLLPDTPHREGVLAHPPLLSSCTVWQSCAAGTNGPHKQSNELHAGPPTCACVYAGARPRLRDARQTACFLLPTLVQDFNSPHHTQVPTRRGPRRPQLLTTCAHHHTWFGQPIGESHTSPYQGGRTNTTVRSHRCMQGVHTVPA